ncbi:MAG: hypothetical protein HXS47_06440 [Theionarchaea archaeon]|nr:hypothetical protein [Theionarchaea archaeon]
MEQNEQVKKDEDHDGLVYIAAGSGLSAVAVAGFVVGSICPVCVVGAPLLVGYGIYKKMKDNKKEMK